MSNIKKPSTSFFLLWIFIVSISTLAAVLLGSKLIGVLWNDNVPYGNFNFEEEVLFQIFLIGLFMGFGEWVVLNIKFKKVHNQISYYWFPATFIGLPVGCVISFFICIVASNILQPIGHYYYKIFEFISLIIFGFAFPFMSGAIVGTLQWLSLKREFKKSLKWELASGHKWSLVSGSSFALSILLIAVLPQGFIKEHSIITGILRVIALGSMPAISGFFIEDVVVYEAKMLNQ